MRITIWSLMKLVCVIFTSLHQYTRCKDATSEWNWAFCKIPAYKWRSPGPKLCLATLGRVTCHLHSVLSILSFQVLQYSYARKRTMLYLQKNILFFDILFFKINEHSLNLYFRCARCCKTSLMAAVWFTNRQSYRHVYCILHHDQFNPLFVTEDWVQRNIRLFCLLSCIKEFHSANPYKKEIVVKINL